jgi:hypothetical protein
MRVLYLVLLIIFILISIRAFIYNSKYLNHKRFDKLPCHKQFLMICGVVFLIMFACGIIILVGYLLINVDLLINAGVELYNLDLPI